MCNIIGPNTIFLKDRACFDRLIDNKDDISNLKKFFAGLWSLANNANVIEDATKRPESFVLKPHHEGQGNKIHGNDARKQLLKLKKNGGNVHAIYMLMQTIFT